MLNTIYKLLASLVHGRLSAAIDKYVCNLQYGFRAERGTTEDIALARRIADIGQATSEEVNMLMLDWEKAFDKINHGRLLEAIHRLNVPDKMM